MFKGLSMNKFGNITISVTNKMQQSYVFMDTFKSALHVSGDSFAHLQEHFYCIYSFLNNSPTLLPTGRQQIRCIAPKSCIYSKSATEDGRKYRPKHVEQNLITVQKYATYSVYYISVGNSTCFVC